MRKFLPVFALGAAFLAQSPSRRREFAAPQTDGRRFVGSQGGPGTADPARQRRFSGHAPGRRGMIQMQMDGRRRIAGSVQSNERFGGLAGESVRSSGCALVAPGTGPTGNTPDVPNFFSALQEQLGLKLERKTGPLDVLVVDQVEKVPTDN